MGSGSMGLEARTIQQVTVEELSFQLEFFKLIRNFLQILPLWIRSNWLLHSFDREITARVRVATPYVLDEWNLVRTRRFVICCSMTLMIYRLHRLYSCIKDNRLLMEMNTKTNLLKITVRGFSPAPHFSFILDSLATLSESFLFNLLF